MHPLALGFMLAVAAPVAAGADGYLRQGAPLPLRLGSPAPARPPLNEAILALDTPAKNAKPEPVAEEVPTTSPQELNAAIAALISRVAALGSTLTNEIPVVATAEVVDSQLTPPPAPTVTPPGPDEGEVASLLPGILTIFHTKDDATNRRNGATVVVPATIFTPPQPATGSRAVYRSQ